MRHIIDQIRTAAEARRPLDIRGGGSKAGILGRAATGEALDITGHRGIVTYRPSELVLTARAGTPLTEIEAALAENDQALSFEPPHFGTGATLGGTLACNLSGPARPWGGSFRDMVLGVRLINGKGEYLRFGGQVMKNVAGYDLSRLQAGALGTLGVVGEISLKVLPAPRSTLTLTEAVDQAGAIRRMNELAGRPVPLSAAAWVDGRLYLRFSGPVPAELAGGKVLDGSDAFWADLREQRLAFFAGDEPLWRLSVASTAPPLLNGAATLIDWGGSQRWIRGGDLATMAAAASAAGGHATLFKGGDRTAEVRQSPPPALAALHQRLKASFDPAGIFNPGRLYGWM